MKPPGALKRIQSDNIPKGHVPNFWEMFFNEDKNPAG